MESLLKDTRTEEEKLLLQILTDLKKENSAESVLNKNILIELLTQKINQPSQFKELFGGYSSNTYYYKKESLVLRFPKLHNPLYRNTSIEIHNLSQAKLLNLTPLKLVAYYTKYSLLVTEFIPNYQSFSSIDFKNTDELIQAAHLIKALHYSQAKFEQNPETATAFIDSTSKTFQRISTILNSEDGIILKKLDLLRNFLKKFKISKRPSHGDFHPFNLIKKDEKLQLMDWELSSIEDPAYDISRFFCVADLSIEQKSIFLQTYQNSCSIRLSESALNNLATRIQLYEPLSYFSIVVWAKYAVLFFYDDQRKLLEETVKNFTAKTLTVLENIDLSSINPNMYVENRYLSTHFALFRPPENQAMQEQIGKVSNLDPQRITKKS
ncbi:MAG: phosphotransferase [Candidatus Aquirickettsiella sp.]